MFISPCKNNKHRTQERVVTIFQWIMLIQSKPKNKPKYRYFPVVSKKTVHKCILNIYNILLLKGDRLNICF